MTRRWAALFVGLMAPALAGAIGAAGESTAAGAAPAATDDAAGERAATPPQPAAVPAQPVAAPSPAVAASHDHSMHTGWGHGASLGGSRGSAAPSPPAGGHDHPGGHEGDEGLVLRPATEESVAGAAACTNDAAVREYEIVALAVDITLNRYGDHDPEGRMYTLASEVAAVREAEQLGGEAVSLGLQGDPIQPLVLASAAGRVPPSRSSPTSWTSPPASISTARHSSLRRMARRLWPPTPPRSPHRGPASCTSGWCRRRSRRAPTCSTPTATRGCSRATACSGRSSWSRRDRRGPTLATAKSPRAGTPSSSRRTARRSVSSSSCTTRSATRPTS